MSNFKKTERILWGRKNKKPPKFEERLPKFGAFGDTKPEPITGCR
jgi:hypothetical protein